MRNLGKFFETIRRQSSEIENDLMDELLAGRIGRAAVSPT